MRTFRFLPLAVLFFTLLTLPSFAQTLHQKQFDDGTGSIGLPAGWRILSAYRGTVQCSKGTEISVDFGVPTIIERPDSMVGQMSARQGFPMAPVGDMTDAIKSILHSGHSQLISLRARSGPASFPGVPAAYYLYQYTFKGQSYSALGYFTTIDPGGDSPYWNLYSSYVTAKTPIFMKSLPTLMAIWNSWHPNGRAPKAGSESAVIDEIVKHSNESFEKLNEKFDKYIRQ